MLSIPGPSFMELTSYLHPAGGSFMELTSYPFPVQRFLYGTDELSAPGWRFLYGTNKLSIPSPEARGSFKELTSYPYPARGSSMELTSECCCNNTANVGSVGHNWNCTAGNLNNSMSIGDKLNGTLATNDVAEATMYLKCKGLICLDKLGMATRNSSPSQGSLLLLNICYGLG
ncbi:hypothetical protein TEA_000753 [Camellia sinensis var. sinensis]|uniref:Uncharacterized protein n=1 Tax=Camellia sinensis var. sinensis TaxID=542762 RepID=A0A4S4DMU9_CAMSN|nr:hypothetical protein TEA_000753 [Camellia sinensis var. sinensis]